MNKNELRKIKWQTNAGIGDLPEYDYCYFHRFCDETLPNGNQTTLALIELRDGKLEKVAISEIQFFEWAEKPKKTL
jgi:hypothetical protein